MNEKEIDYEKIAQEIIDGMLKDGFTEEQIFDAASAAKDEDEHP